MESNWPSIRWDPREPPPPQHVNMGVSHVAMRAVHHPNDLSDVDQAGHTPPHYVASFRQPASHQTGRYQPRGQVPYPLKGSPKSDGFLHPFSASVDVRILQDTAKVSITHLFVNTTSQVIPEAKYTFPLPSGSMITDFDCQIGRDKILKGIVKPKKEARDTYHRTRRRNRTAGLLDQHTPEVFTTSIGNIPANVRLKARISFIVLLKYGFYSENCLTTFTLPLNVAPRYGTVPASLQDALSSISVLRKLSMQIDVLAPEDIISIKSTSHDVQVEYGTGSANHQSWASFARESETKDPKTALVSLPDHVTHLEKDFVLEICTRPDAGLECPYAVVETHPSLENHQAIMLTVPPKFMLKNQRTKPQSSEVVFIADRSGSMAGNMEALKSAMEFFLRGLPEDTNFNIWSFGSTYDFLWHESQTYSEESLQQALSYVSHEFDSNLGGTDLLLVLKEVIAARGEFDSSDIIVLTDGHIWDQDAVMDLLQEVRTSSNGAVRFFSLGIGDGVSHELVEGIAKVGGGYAEVIPDAGIHALESRVVAVLSATLTGHVDQMSVELNQEVLFDDSQTDNGVPKKIAQSPTDTSTLSPFIRNRIFMLLEDKPKTGSSLRDLVIRTTNPAGEDICFTVPIKALEQKDTMIHKLGARALLGDLQRGQTQMQLDASGTLKMPREVVRAEGERLGCKWSLVSKWTSLVLVEEPVTAEEHDADLFLYADEPALDRTDEDTLGLLRPHGNETNEDLDYIEAVIGLELESSDDEDDEHDGHDSDSYSQNYTTCAFSGSYADATAIGPELERRSRRFSMPRHVDSEERDSDKNNTEGIEDNDTEDGNPDFWRTELNIPIGGPPPVQIFEACELVNCSTPGPPNLQYTYNYNDRGDIPQGDEAPLASTDDSFARAILNVQFQLQPGSQHTKRPSVMLGAEPMVQQPEEERTKEDLIRRLISFQRYNGEITVSPLGQTTLIYAVLGDNFKQWTDKMHHDIDSLLTTQEERDKVALTLAVIAALERDFQSCATLWERLVDKAKTFVLKRVPRDVFDPLISRAAQSLDEYGVVTWPVVEKNSTINRRVPVDFAPMDE
ncbi:hypothetical protein QQX98_001634 [Neonectria punicea]|uniref:VWFA domain-containing protein n=1 Tax=Neonectria punicea TaxID=979145 RepID=A0ABR1HMB9_9HYPO